MKMTGGKAFAEALKREGVKHIFGYPGGAILPFYDDLYKYSEHIEHILVRHEQGAAHMAEGYAVASGKVGVCLATSGPGATNLVTGITDALLDSRPIVAISGQVSTQAIGNDAFQEADLFGITMPITKHNYKVLNIKDVPFVVKSAFHIASSGRPGPVHIDLPKDIQTGEYDFHFPDKIELPGYKPKLDPHPIQLKKAVEMLLKAERPLILAGGGVISANASQELTRLAEALMIPVTSTFLGKGAIDGHHPLYLGAAGMHGRKVSNYAITNCDLLFGIGTRFSDRTTFDLKHFAPLAKVIHADVDPAEIGKNVRVDLPIVGDAKKVLHGILSILHEMKHSGKASAWTKHMEEMEKICRCDIEVDSVPISAARVMHELNKHVPTSAIVTTDVGQHQMWAEHFFKVTHSRHFISSGGLGTMGFGFPAAIGAKKACTDKPVACITSEGSLLMMFHEMATSINNNLPVAIIMLNNNWLGMVKQWQKHFYGNRYIGVDMGKMPDFVKLTESFGGEGVVVTRPSELGEAIKKAIKSDVTFMVDIRTDPEEDMLPMVPPGGRIDKMISSTRCGPIDKAMDMFTRVK